MGWGKVRKNIELFSANEQTEDEINAFNKIVYKTCYFLPLTYTIKGGKGYQESWKTLEKT